MARYPDSLRGIWASERSPAVAVALVVVVIATSRIATAQVSVVANLTRTDVAFAVELATVGKETAAPAVYRPDDGGGGAVIAASGIRYVPAAVCSLWDSGTAGPRSPSTLSEPDSSAAIG